MPKRLINDLLDTVDAVDSVKNSVKGLLYEIRQDSQNSVKTKSKKSSKDMIIDEPTFVDHGNVTTESTTTHYTSSGDYKNEKFLAPQLYKNPDKERKSAVAQQVLGYGLAGTGAIFSVGNVLSMIASGFEMGSFLGAAFFGAGAILFLILGVSGTAKALISGRFKEYIEAFGKKTILSFKELGAAIGKSERFVRDDIKKLIDKKYFKQGHIDSDDQLLITADATYKDYVEYEKRMKEYEAQDQDYEAMLRDRGFTPEGIRIVKLCEEQTAQIRAINEVLPEEVISRKLDLLENTVREMLQEVKKQPQKAGELRKTTNYYLPTIIKLFENYIEIEKEEKKTQKLQDTQAEIETMLDTLNESFKVLLSKLQQNREWDVSADISVMKTMLNMEGLSNENKINKK